MLSDLPSTELIHLAYQSIEELTIVTHDDCRTVKGFDSLFQHFL